MAICCALEARPGIREKDTQWLLWLLAKYVNLWFCLGRNQFKFDDDVDDVEGEELREVNANSESKEIVNMYRCTVYIRTF